MNFRYLMSHAGDGTTDLLRPVFCARENKDGPLVLRKDRIKEAQLVLLCYHKKFLIEKLGFQEKAPKE